MVGLLVCSRVRFGRLAMTGHVFVVRSDLTHLSCDAWLVPTDDSVTVEDPWSAFLPNSDGWKRGLWSDGTRAQRVVTGSSGAPDIWVGNIGAVDVEASWYADGATEFVRKAAAVIRAERQGLRPPLVALPLVGTRTGGGARRKGEIFESLFTELHSLTRHDPEPVDVVVVCWDAKSHAAAQRARIRVLTGGSPDGSGQMVQAWPFTRRATASKLGQRAIELADHARRGDLAVFFGAGVSTGAGLPGWTDLLASIGANVDPPVTRVQLADLDDPRDQAVLLERRLATAGMTIGEVLPSKLPAERYSLLHGLLASLPVREFTTTNFDELFEIAATSDNRRLRVVPDGPTGELPRPARGAHDPLEPARWLLKLHGTVSDPSSIVLTRGSFIEAPRQRGALLGMVQAMLLTREMLFIGYSLRDEDFHELVHEVRYALPPSSRGDNPSLGTAITLFDDPMHTEIWKGDVDVMAVSPAVEPNDDPQQRAVAAGREVELWLDLLSLLASDYSRFLLDPDYAGMLTDDELALANQLRQLKVHDGEAEGWTALAEFLQRFGQDPLD